MSSGRMPRLEMNMEGAMHMQTEIALLGTIINREERAIRKAVEHIVELTEEFITQSEGSFATEIRGQELLNYNEFIRLAAQEIIKKTSFSMYSVILTQPDFDARYEEWEEIFETEQGILESLAKGKVKIHELARDVGLQNAVEKRFRSIYERHEFRRHFESCLRAGKSHIRDATPKDLEKFEKTYERSMIDDEAMVKIVNHKKTNKTFFNDPGPELELFERLFAQTNVCGEKPVRERGYQTATARVLVGPNGDEQAFCWVSQGPGKKKDVEYKKWAKKLIDKLFPPRKKLTEAQVTEKAFFVDHLKNDPASGVYLEIFTGAESGMGEQIFADTILNLKDVAPGSRVFAQVIRSIVAMIDGEHKEFENALNAPSWSRLGTAGLRRDETIDHNTKQTFKNFEVERGGIKATIPAIPTWKYQHGKFDEVHAWANRVAIFKPQK